MNFLSKLFAPSKDKAQAKIDALDKALAPFSRAAMSRYALESSDATSERRRLATAFIFGGAAYLAEYDGLNPVERYRFAGQVIADCFSLNDTQRLAYEQELPRTPQQDLARFFMIEGASAVRRLMIFGDEKPSLSMAHLIEQQLIGR